jgi:hypothetical protein
MVFNFPIFKIKFNKTTMLRGNKQKMPPCFLLAGYPVGNALIGPQLLFAFSQRVPALLKRFSRFIWAFRKEAPIPFR